MAGRLAVVLTALVCAVAAPIQAAPAPAAEVRWSVSPDPIPNAEAALKLKPGLTIAPVFQADRDLLFPNRPSRFVLTISLLAGGFELWDLGTGNKVRESRGKLDVTEPILSPDGQYVAGSKAGVLRTPPGIEIWSLKTGLLLRRIAGDDPTVAPHALGFVGSDKIAIHTLSSGVGAIQIYSIASGQKLASWDTSTVLLRDNVVFSPNGNFIAENTNGVLEFHDTASGQPAGHVDFNAAITAADTNKFPPRSFAFSPDGSELAAISAAFDHCRLQIVSIKNGLVTTGETFDEKTPLGATFNNLQYSADGAQLLLDGKTLIDRPTLAAVYELPASPGIVYARFADATHVLQIVKKLQQLNFATVSISKDLVAKSIAAIKSGGRAEDASLNPLTKPDLSSATAASLALPAGSAWQVKPPAAGPLRQNIQPFFPIHASPLMEKYQNENPTAQLEASGLFFGSRESHQLAVEYSAIDPSNVGGPFRHAAAWIVVYDLNGGSTLGELAIPAALECMDLSASGKVIACRGGTDVDRVDSFKSEQGGFKPWISFRPYDDAIPAAPAAPATGVPAPQPRPDEIKSARRVEAIVWIDDTHLLTLSGKGKLALWQLPAAKAIWTGTLRSSKPVLALSPDRKLACNADAEVFEPLSGKTVGQAELKESSCAAATFSPDGQQLVILKSGNWNGSAQWLDLATGKVVAEAPLSPIAMVQAGTPEVLSGTYLLLQSGDLVSAEKKAIIERYALKANPYGTPPRRGNVFPFDRAFFVAPREGRVPTSIVNVALPDDAARNAALALRPQEIFSWTPGSRVSLNINVVGDENFKKAQIAAWTEQLTAHGFKVVENSTNIIRANSMVLSGPPIKYKADGNVFSVTPYLPGYEISLTVSGVEVWKNALTSFPKDYFPSGIVSFRREPGETYQQAADRTNPKPTSSSTIILPPDYILRDRQIETTGIGPRGVEAPITAPPAVGPYGTPPNGNQPYGNQPNGNTPYGNQPRGR